MRFKKHRKAMQPMRSSTFNDQLIANNASVRAYNDARDALAMKHEHRRVLMLFIALAGLYGLGFVRVFMAIADSVVKLGGIHG